MCILSPSYYISATNLLSVKTWSCLSLIACLLSLPTTAYSSYGNQNTICLRSVLADSIPAILCPDEHIPHYYCYRVADPIRIDGKLDEAIWSQVERSHAFKDLISGEDTYLKTQAALVWDDTNIYVAYWVEEPYLQASLLDRDAPIYRDNDVELFIAGKNAYYEFEINAYNTIYEVFFIWEASFEQAGYHKLE